MISQKTDYKKPVLLCDSAIFPLTEYLARDFSLLNYEAGAFQSGLLQQSDGLLVRSVTPVTAAMLQKTSCRFVGSATAGINHLDIVSLEKAGIAWAHAPGANADAVVEYILSALYLAKLDRVLQPGDRIAIIGCGEVGGRVLARVQALGYQVCAYDPPKASREPGFKSAVMGDVLSCSWVICCASYQKDGPFSSHHLLSQSLLADWQVLRGVINAARGELIDYDALFALKKKRWTCLDVWPNEPNLDARWAMQATIATPHIAGYTIEAKRNLSLMLYKACCDFFMIPARVEWLNELDQEPKITTWSDTVKLRDVSDNMKAKAAFGGDYFHALRKAYPIRVQQYPYL